MDKISCDFLLFSTIAAHEIGRLVGISTEYDRISIQIIPKQRRNDKFTFIHTILPGNNVFVKVDKGKKSA